MKVDLALRTCRDSLRSAALGLWVFAPGRMRPFLENPDNLPRVELPPNQRCANWLKDRQHAAVGIDGRRVGVQLSALETGEQAELADHETGYTHMPALIVAVETGEYDVLAVNSKGEKYDPALDFPPEILRIGSDFSTAGIRRLVSRNQRLNQARHCAKTQWRGPMA
jgi:hypothetical protein